MENANELSGLKEYVENSTNKLETIVGEKEHKYPEDK